MSGTSFEQVLDIKAGAGEAPIWSAEEQALYWIDIRECTVNRFDPATGLNARWPFPSRPGSMVLRQGGGGLIAARDGLYEMDFTDGTCRHVLEPPFNKQIFRFNDGRTDRQGRFCLGTLINTITDGGDQDFRDTPFQGTGILYTYDGLKLMPIVAPLAVSNGTAISPDGRTLYRADTRGRVIYAHDYDPEMGLASNQRIFARTPETLGLPDGACVDAEGGYWVALPAGPDGGSVARFTPEGKLDFHIETPVPIPTMPAFGGSGLATLYVTTGRIETFMGAEAHPLSGDIFAVETGFRGCPETPFISRAAT